MTTTPIPDFEERTKGPEDIANDICLVLGLYRPGDYTTIAGLLHSWSEALLSERETLAREKAELVEKVRVLSEALEFYADPDSYCAIGFFPDRPCGEFMDDFSRVADADYNRPMPGMKARAALARALSPEPIGADYPPPPAGKSGGEPA